MDSFDKPMLEIFEDVPIDKYLSKRKGKLPTDLPPKIKKKLLQDAKFFGELDLPVDPTTASPGILGMETTSYPNYDYNMHTSPPADTRKWLEATRSIFYLVHKGEDRGQALMRVIGQWSKNEKRDFINWLKFYEEGGHTKYKAGMETTPLQAAAQVQWYDHLGQLGYPMPEERRPPSFDDRRPAPYGFDAMKSPETHPDIAAAEAATRRIEMIEAQRRKILSRLDSAEKLLRSQEGNIFAGNDLEAILNAIYQLKNRVHTVNKQSLSTQLYEDLIIREANILTKRGFTKVANVLHKVAQDIQSSPEANNPLQMGGVPGNFPGEGPGMEPLKNDTVNDTSALTDPTGQAPQTSQVASPTALPLPPPAAGQTQSLPQPNVDTEPDISPGMKDFLRNISEGKDTFDPADEDNAPNPNTPDLVSPASLILGLKLQAALVIETLLNRSILVSEAQEAPVAEEIEVNEPKRTDPDIQADKNFDKILDSAFQQLTVSDAIARLDDLAKVFKVREIPRQISIVDMMLDRLGIASFFPSLGECVQKSHEANNYCSTRVEDILSRLRGTLATKNIDLTGETPPITPELQAIHDKLKDQGEQEAARKKTRKELANKELDKANPNKPVPDLEVAEDLNNPPPAPPPAGPTPQPENLRLNRPR